MGVQWCSHTSGWASAPLAVLDRTGWSRDRNSKCLLLRVLLPWIKGLPRQALLLTSLSSCAARLAGTILLRPFTVCHHFGERRCTITGAHLCYTSQLLRTAWTRTRKSRHHGKIQQMALHSTKDPSIPSPPKSLWDLVWIQLMQQLLQGLLALSPWHMVHLKPAATKIFNCYKWCLKVQGDDKLDP